MQNVSSEPGFLSLRQIYAMLAARRALILNVAGSLFFLTVMLTLLLPRTWTASSSLYINYREDDPLGGQGLSALLDDSYMQTQLELIHSQRVAELMIERLRLHDTPEYRTSVARHGKDRAEQLLVKDLLDSSRIEHSRGSRVVTINFDADSPLAARDLADAMVRSYIELGEQMTSSRARSRFEQYNAQLEQLRNEVDRIQDELTRYQQQHDILSVQEHGDQESARLTELNKTLLALQTELQDARSAQAGTRALLASGIAPDETPLAAQSPIIHMLKEQLSIVDRQLGDVQGRLGPRHPTIRGLAAERQKLLTRIRREADALLTGADSRVAQLAARADLLQSDIDQQRGKVLALMKARNQIATYERQLASAQQIYSAALKSYDTLSMASNVLSPNVTILRTAELPATPSRPRIGLNLALGLLAGLLVGVLLALLLELLQRRVRTADDLLYDPELPLLGQVGLTERLA
ncbi:GumC family protein [Castellaniella defragrans]|uniref:GumC family protein n=1 Tax=Castellaniella defragrans TaxID=75697 RepID=UPI002B0012CB|nr:GumC family protein [Castellaniella defragrans]